MAFDEHLAERIRTTLHQKKVVFDEKKMMGGLCIMVDDKMLAGVMKSELMARVDPQDYNDLLNYRGSKEMKFTGKVMRGFLLISSEGIDMDKDLEYWLDLCLEFNPKAKSSKKK